VSIFKPLDCSSPKSLESLFQPEIATNNDFSLSVIDKLLADFKTSIQSINEFRIQEAEAAMEDNKAKFSEHIDRAIQVSTDLSLKFYNHFYFAVDNSLIPKDSGDFKKLDNQVSTLLETNVSTETSLDLEAF
jgi:hypothetical protein